MLQADSSKVSDRAKKRGLPQLGTLGAGNHYAEIQVVDEIYDVRAANKMGIDHVGQVCIMIHSGSRGLGHQVATDALVEMEKAMARDNIVVNDRQLACARIQSEAGQNYLKAMAAAANFAWVNRSSMAFLARQVRRRGKKTSFFWGGGGGLTIFFFVKGVCKGVQQHPRRPRHARHLRRFAQYCQGRGARTSVSSFDR